MRLLSYARVSTSQQSLNLQIERLKESGVSERRIFFYKASGDNMQRSSLETLLIKVEEEDVVLITKLDRLGRNTLDMVELIEKFEKIHVAIQSLDDGVSTDGAMGEAVANAERARIIAHKKAG